MCLLSLVTFSMPWGATINWNMPSNWNQRVLELMLPHPSLSASSSSPVSASSERTPSSQQPTRRHSDRHQGDPGVPPGLRHRSMSDSRGSPRGEIKRLAWGFGNRLFCMFVRLIFVKNKLRVGSHDKDPWRFEICFLKYKTVLWLSTGSTSRICSDQIHIFREGKYSKRSGQALNTEH